MFRPRIIPCLLVRDGGLVKTVQFGKETYIGDPLNTVRLFNNLNADELIFLDIDAAKENRTIDPRLTGQIGAQAYMPFSVGGGIRTLKDAARLIEAGAEKVVLNTAAARRPELIREIAERFGNQSVIVAIDVVRQSNGDYVTILKDGTERTHETPWDAARRFEAHGAGEILIQSVDHDGVMAGYDLDLIKKMSEHTRVPLIALGGAGSYTHFKEAVAAGASAAAAGSLFVFQGPRNGVLINYPSAAEKVSIFQS